jgi:hypothetical protein
LIQKQYGSPICLLKCGRRENRGERREKKSKEKKKRMVRHSPIIAHPSTYTAYGGKMWRGASKNTIEGPNQMPKVATRATPV